MRLFKSHQADHIAAALIGRHDVEQLGAAVKDSYARRTEHLMAGKSIKVAADILDVNFEMGYRLCPVHQNRHIPPVRPIDDRLDRVHRAERIGHVHDRDELRPLIEQLFVCIQPQFVQELTIFVDHQFAVVIHRNHA